MKRTRDNHESDDLDNQKGIYTPDFTKLQPANENSQRQDARKLRPQSLT